MILAIIENNSFCANNWRENIKTTIALESLQMREYVNISLIILRRNKNVVHSRMLLTINH